MEKLLVAINSRILNENAISFACYLARLSQSKLTGIFLEEPAIEEDLLYKQMPGGVYLESVSINDTREDNVLLRKLNMSQFRKLTQEEDVEAIVHLDKGVPEDEIIAESRFADALIVDAATSFWDEDDVLLTGFIKNVLHDAGCPVIICPESFMGIDNIIFCYDGSKSSVFAIKQFTYLFPQFKTNNLKILYLKGEESPLTEEGRRLAEWLQYHYENEVEWVIPLQDTKESIFEFIVDKKDDFIVMGPYGKGLLTSFLKKEDEQVSALPIFVSHF